MLARKKKKEKKKGKLLAYVVEILRNGVFT